MKTPQPVLPYPGLKLKVEKSGDEMSCNLKTALPGIGTSPRRPLFWPLLSRTSLPGEEFQGCPPEGEPGLVIRGMIYELKSDNLQYDTMGRRYDRPAI